MTTMATNQDQPKIDRALELAAPLEKKSYFLLGPRQTGRITLIRVLRSDSDTSAMNRYHRLGIVWM